LLGSLNASTSALTAVEVHALVWRSPLFYYILISGRVRARARIAVSARRRQ